MGLGEIEGKWSQLKVFCHQVWASPGPKTLSKYLKVLACRSLLMCLATVVMRMLRGVIVVKKDRRHS